MSQNSRWPVHTLPGVISAGHSGFAPPDLALRHILASHVHAPGLLSGARYRASVAADSAEAAAHYARACRNSEIAYEIAVRRDDPRGARNWHIGRSAVVGPGRLAVCGGAGLLLAWAMEWPERILLAVATIVIGGCIAWRASVSREKPAPGFILAAAGLCGLLVMIRLVTTAGPWLVRLGGALLAALVLGAAIAAAAYVLSRTESWQCWRLRKASDRAVRQRDDTLTQACLDESAAHDALTAWESVVVEECQLAHPGTAVSDGWLADCVATARSLVGSAGGRPAVTLGRAGPDGPEDQQAITTRDVASS